MKNININKRLKKISAYLLNSKKIIDIGCDHALLGIYLCLENENIKVIASDINEKPLLKAKENVNQYSLNDRIAIKLGDGLETVEEDVDTVVISGMGTLNIIKILEKINEYPHISKLVLSPNNDFVLLREKIQNLGFEIVKEEIIKENNKYYLIIEFKKGNNVVNNFFGKLDLNNDINIDYFKYLYNKNNKIIKSLKTNDILKRDILIKENNIIKSKVVF